MTAAMAASPPYPQSPVVEQNIAIVTLIVNLFVPGIGTIIAGVVGNKPMIGRGIAQLLLSIIIVGWIWAIVTGVQVLQNSSWADKNRGVAGRPM